MKYAAFQHAPPAKDRPSRSPDSSQARPGQRAMTEALLASLPTPDDALSLASACRTLAAQGFRASTVAQLIRTSGLCEPAAPARTRSVACADTAYRLTEAGRNAWNVAFAAGRLGAAVASVGKPHDALPNDAPATRAEGEPPASVEPPVASEPESAPGAVPSHSASPAVSLAGFGRTPENSVRVLACLRALGAGAWVGAAELHAALRAEFGWAEAVTAGMINSALGTLAAREDLERRKHAHGWEYRPVA